MTRAEIKRRNNVVIEGTGERSMIFAHGFIGDQTLWRRVANVFRKNYQVVLFDYVGSGRSDPLAYKAGKYSTLEGYAQDVLDICEAVDLTNTIFVGHSISAMIGLIAAVRRPELFSDLIMVAPSPRYINDTGYHGGFDKEEIDTMLRSMNRDYVGWANDLVPKVIHANPDIANEVMLKLMSANQQVAVNFAKATFFSDYRKALLEINIPSLILQCADDIMAPLDVGDYLHAHLRRSTLRRLSAIGHFPQLSAPQEVVKAIQDYLAK